MYDNDPDYYGGPDYEERETAGGKMSAAFGSLCLGIVLFPVSLAVLGYNEQLYMCTHKNILYAQKMAEVISCNEQQSFFPDMVVYLACPIHEDSLHVYTPASFGSSGLGQSITFRSSAGAQTAEMYQCVESSHEEKCGKDEKCRAYSYKMEWLRHPVDSNSFSMTGQAQQARQSGCPGFQGNPPWPHDVLPTVETSWAESIRAGPVTVSKSLLKGGNSQFSGLAPNMDRPVQLSSFANSFLPIHMLPIMPPRGGFSSVTTRTAAIDASGTKIVTCSQPRVGCLQIRYFKNWDASVSLISKIEGGYTVPMQVPASWGCSTSSFDALSAGSMSLASFSAQLEDANTTRTWFLRVLGLVFTWLTVYCCFQPIAAAADIVGDCLAYIPCVGEFMEDLLEGMVDTLLCMVSCGVGCSCGLLVIGIVWLFMRPLIGGGLLLVCVVLGICAFAVAHQHKANKDINDQSVQLKEMYDNDSP
ncbi:unnamed protein product [Symbiodinium sp. CCMP2592]|nr:unnamed protein product [Symbiodinium sp. CCMP2592]